MTGIHHGADHSKNDHVQKIACRMMTKLKAKQTGFTVDAEIKPEVIMQLVMKLSALSNSRNPILKKLHIGIRP